MVLFAAVVREGSLTRAARSLGITKQTVSERLTKLEGRLGVRLLERSTRHLRTTDEGAAYYERCATIAALIEEANHEVLARRAEPAGLLRVTAPTLYGRRFLMPVIADLLTRYPSLQLQVMLSDRRVDLIEEGFDLAIRVGALGDSSFAAKKIGEGYTYLVASPRLLAAYHPRPLTPESLRELPIIGIRPVENWSIGGVRLTLSPTLVVNDLEMACQAAVAGVGVAQLPSLVCQNELRDGRLRVLFGAESMARRPVYAVYPSRLYTPPKVRVFLEALRTMVAPMAPVVWDEP